MLIRRFSKSFFMFQQYPFLSLQKLLTLAELCLNIIYVLDFTSEIKKNFWFINGDNYVSKLFRIYWLPFRCQLVIEKLCHRRWFISLVTMKTWWDRIFWFGKYQNQLWCFVWYQNQSCQSWKCVKENHHEK